MIAPPVNKNVCLTCRQKNFSRTSAIVSYYLSPIPSHSPTPHAPNPLRACVHVAPSSKCVLLSTLCVVVAACTQTESMLRLYNL